MPTYQRKPFKAQQWNQPGDVPSWAYGKVTEREDGFEVIQNDVMKIFTGKPGDYICQRPDGGLIYVCRQHIFEACNSLAFTPTFDMEKAYDNNGVDSMAQAMRARLSDKRLQGFYGWWNKEQCSIEQLRGLLMEAVAKGKMVDIANFAMMVYCREIEQQHD